LSRIIIGIHGLGNKAPRKVLQQWWKKAIQEGLATIGQPHFCFNFELVYWAQILYPEPLDPNERDPRSPRYLEHPYLPARSYKNYEPNKLKTKVLRLLEKQMDTILLNKDMSINFSAITDLIIRKYFNDLDIYFSRRAVTTQTAERLAKEVIREQLIKILEKHRGKEILLLAHSMGSIIAYDVLTLKETEIKINTLVTIGSPLGLPIVISKIFYEQNGKYSRDVRVRTPETVQKQWYNFSDLDDKVALDPTLSDDYEANTHHVHAVDVIIQNDYEFNGERNPHNIYGYLRAPELAEVLHAFLSEDKPLFLCRWMNRINQWLYANIKKIKQLKK
jgi:hypothetical protein